MAALVIAGARGAVEGDEAPTRIVILHDNDLHFTLNHTERVREAIESVRARHRHVFLVNAGDLFVRYPRQWPRKEGREFYRRKSEEVVRTMNRLRYDAATLGNHELDVHGDITGRSLRLAEFPLLGANIDVRRAALPPPLPYTILRTDGLSLAVVGLSVVDFTPAQVAARDPLETFAAYAHLGREHDVLIALTHIGVMYDVGLAHRFPEIDVVIGGHTHTLLPTGLPVNDVLVVHTGGHAHAPDATRPMQLGEVVLVLRGRTIVEKCAFVYAIDEHGPRPLARSAEGRPFGAGTCGQHAGSN